MVTVGDGISGAGDPDGGRDGATGGSSTDCRLLHAIGNTISDSSAVHRKVRAGESAMTIPERPAPRPLSSPDPRERPTYLACRGVFPIRDTPTSLARPWDVAFLTPLIPLAQAAWTTSLQPLFAASRRAEYAPAISLRSV
jgi:hypothetical protein